MPVQRRLAKPESIIVKTDSAQGDAHIRCGHQPRPVPRLVLSLQCLADVANEIERFFPLPNLPQTSGNSPLRDKRPAVGVAENLPALGKCLPIKLKRLLIAAETAGADCDVVSHLEGV